MPAPGSTATSAPSALNFFTVSGEREPRLGRIDFLGNSLRRRGHECWLRCTGSHLILRSAAAQLGLSVADLNEEFGVRPLDAERSLYAVLVCSESLPAGPFSDPKIAPFGPLRKKTKG